MNNLEEKFLKAFNDYENNNHGLTKSQAAIVAAELALQVAEKAYNAGIEDCNCDSDMGFFEEFKKEIL